MWTSAEQWLGESDPVDHDRARAALLERWLRTFGPATVDDVKWWFGHTLTWAREALRAVGAVEVDLGRTTGWSLPDDLEPEPVCEPWCALLPGLDVTTMGWQDRDWYLGEHRAKVFDRNGNAGPTAWCDGRIVGGWVQDSGGRVILQLVESLDATSTKRLAGEAERLTEWLDGVRISPRFPSPLAKTGVGPATGTQKT
jgi:Winged helix DNA-binding domain